MSATNVSISTETVVDNPKPVRVRKPTLPAKSDKLIVFGVFFVQKLIDNNLLSTDNLRAAHDNLLLFHSVQDQIDFYNRFFDDFKAHKKTTALIIKPPKAPKEPKPPKAPKEPKAPKAPKAPKEPKADTAPKAPKAPKEPKEPKEPKAPKEPKPKTEKAPKPKTEKETDTDKKEPAKRGRKKAVTVVNQNIDDDNIVNQLVSIATASISETNQTEQNEQNEQNDDDDDDDEDLVTREIIIDGKQFLVDDDNNLYQFTPPHLPAGKL